MIFTRPTLHHILYIETNDVKNVGIGVLRDGLKSIWVELDHKWELEVIEESLASLHRSGHVKLYFVFSCEEDDEHSFGSTLGALEHLGKV